MAYFSNVADQSIIASRDDTFAKYTAGPKALNKRGRFRRFLDAMMQSRQRQADRDIVRFLQNSGGKLTDDAEREIERRFLQR